MFTCNLDQIIYPAETTLREAWLSFLENHNPKTGQEKWDFFLMQSATLEAEKNGGCLELNEQLWQSFSQALKLEMASFDLPPKKLEALMAANAKAAEAAVADVTVAADA